MVENKSDKVLLVCDESSITCATFRQLQSTTTNSEDNVVLGMPRYEYQKGKRGWAKANILSSIAPQINETIGLDYEEVLEEIVAGTWKKVIINGRVIWTSTESVQSGSDSQNIIQLQIEETSSLLDLALIDRSKQVIKKSNCWYNPAGVVFAKGKNILVECASTSFNGSGCKDIPLDPKDLPLDAGERMFFCDSLHAERVGIAEAAKRGLSLSGSTMYVSKFPCRPCAMNAISAGITTIVFEEGSYGLIETADLFAVNNITLKKTVAR